jgi:hypothetical protein
VEFFLADQLLGGIPVRSRSSSGQIRVQPPPRTRVDHAATYHRQKPARVSCSHPCSTARARVAASSRRLPAPASHTRGASTRSRPPPAVSALGRSQPRRPISSAGLLSGFNPDLLRARPRMGRFQPRPASGPSSRRSAPSPDRCMRPISAQIRPSFRSKPSPHPVFPLNLPKSYIFIYSSYAKVCYMKIA